MLEGRRLSEVEHASGGSTLDLVPIGAPQFVGALLNGVLGCAAVIDPAGRYFYANQDYLDFVGRPAQEVIGSTVLEVLGESVHRSYQLVMRDLFAGKTIRREGWNDYGPLGNRYIEQTITAYQLGEGPISGYIAFSRDLTDLKMHQRELIERIEAQNAADAYHAVIVDNALDAIVVIDEMGAVVDFNPAAVSIFGYSRDEAMGQQISELIIPISLRSAHNRGIASYIDSGTTRILGRRLELEAVRSTGELIPVELTITEVKLGAKRLFAAHLRDLSTARQAQAEIERQRDALHQNDKLAALGSLLAGVAHELNNPLSIVIGQAMMLREKSLDTPMAEELAQRSVKIEIAANRCARIVRSFLDMARQRKHQRDIVVIPELIHNGLELLSYNLKSSGVVVETDFPDDLPPLWIDGDQIHQVIVNLVVNAYQALEEKTDGQRRIRIAAEHVPEAQTIVLRISDNGTGIPSSIRSRIFDPYFTTKPQGSGTGIGLAVSRGLIESHGGTLELDPAQGPGGAHLIVRLPIVVPDGDSHLRTPLKAENSPGGIEQSILIIDDEVEIADLLADIVRKIGFRAVVAYSGQAAKICLKQAGLSIDAILCDIRMPDGDGPSFFDWLGKTHPALAGRIGFITGDTLGPAAGRFLARSGCPVIEKPFTPGDIKRILAALTKAGADV
ncbi:PAS domain S-box protein [Pararhizobium sp.]|uniref:PAS domain S-box protein n=1 Tax=Pararhizobium sp. TaxID=1977563 RepID=UPI003D0DADC6